MQIRKVSAEEAARWEAPPSATALRLLLFLQSGGDVRGITRIDRSGRAGGEHAWRARVYTRGVELHRQFADVLYGGPAGSLRQALAWRDDMRQIAGGRPPRRGYTPRIVRAEYNRMCGWLAYAPYAKKYFADSAHSGREAGYATAQAWLAEQLAPAAAAGRAGLVSTIVDKRR